MAKAKQKVELYVETLTEILKGTSEDAAIAESKIDKANFGPNKTQGAKNFKATRIAMENDGVLGMTKRGALYLTGGKAKKAKAAAVEYSTKDYPWSKGMKSSWIRESIVYWDYIKPRLAGWGLKSAGAGCVTLNVFMGKWVEVMAAGGVNQKKVVRLLRDEGFKGKKYDLKSFDASDAAAHDSEAAYDVEMARIKEHAAAGKSMKTFKHADASPIVRKIKAKAEKKANGKKKVKTAKKTGAKKTAKSGKKKGGKAKAKKAS